MDCEDSLDALDEEVSFSFMANENTTNQETDYTILSEEDVRNRLENDITTISTLLSISRAWASILLRNYDWNVTSVHENWFSNEEKVRTVVGLLEKPVVIGEDPNSDTVVACKTCYGTFLVSNMYAACCGHLLCSWCWKEHGNKLMDGNQAGCILMLQCPESGCFAAVDDEMVGRFLSDEDRKKYSNYLLRSYVESSKKIKWCPAPGCGCAVEFELTSENYNVTCKCLNRFCWKCGEDAHLPIDCDTVAKWILKNKLESRKTDVNLARSKNCPTCNKPIEKIQGCMHMTCASPCNFEFCWLCRLEWSEHGKKTGELYVCNCYERTEEEGEDKTMLDKHALERYSHYYERWAVNEWSRQTAIEDLYEIRTVHIKKLAQKQYRLPSQLKFIIKAWKQIIECRCVLKWSYAYGYYIPQQEDVKIELFEYLQGQAESCLEHLHQCAEEDIQKYIDAEGWSEDFMDFQKKICNLTSSTHIYFGSFVKAQQKGLSDVKCADPSMTDNSKDPGSGKKKRKRICVICTLQNESFASTCEMCGSTVRYGMWSCEQCTYLNGRYSTRCLMCDLPRPSLIE